MSNKTIHELDSLSEIAQNDEMLIYDNSAGADNPTKKTTVGKIKDFIANNIKYVYSTDEVKTNKVWIDGKPIYERVIEYGDGSTAIAQDTAITILNNVSIAKIINWSGTAVYDNNVDYALPNNATIIYNNHTNITYSEHAMQSKKLYITIEYTKTTD